MSRGWHPYQSQPDAAFWSRAVAGGADPIEFTLGYERPLLVRADRVASMGSCFASNLVPYLEGAGIEYVRAEQPLVEFVRLPENFGYRNFSAAYGNIYCVRQMLQLVQRAEGWFAPLADRWHEDGSVVDPFRPGLRFPARGDAEFDALQRQHLAAVRRVLREATVLILTLGLTEAWADRRDGAVYPSCPGTIAGEFDASIHEFVNFTADEVRADLLALVDSVREVNPGMRFVVTVSPVPLVATATDRHVLTATTYSKSVLRVAAEAAVTSREGVAYFPAYEIVTGPQAPDSFFEEDRRNVSREGVEAVMSALVASCDLGGAAVGTPEAVGEARQSLAQAAWAVVDAECEEATVDV